MTTPRSSSDGPGEPMSPAVMKGGALIAVALLLGLFLLVKGTDTSDTADASSGPDVTEPADVVTDGSTPPTTEAAGDTTTTTTVADAGDVVPGDVTVLVANASGIPGAASVVSAEIAEAGFITADPANALEGGIVDPGTTVVYYVENQEAEGVAVAAVLGLAASSVEPMPDTLPVEDMRGATVLVMLGTDLAPTA